MNALWALMCGFLILLAIEIRNRWIFEEMTRFKDSIDKLSNEVVKLNSQLSMKMDVYEKNK